MKAAIFLIFFGAFATNSFGQTKTKTCTARGKIIYTNDIDSKDRHSADVFITNTQTHDGTWFYCRSCGYVVDSLKMSVMVLAHTNMSQKSLEIIDRPTEVMLLDLTSGDFEVFEK